MPLEKARTTIPLAEPFITGNAWQYVKECLDSGWVSSVGSMVTEFERSVACYVGCQHSIATSSGTAALHLALLVAGVQPNDEVVLPALTFIAPANAVRYCGAWPIFIDVEPSYWQIDVDSVEDYLASHTRMTERGLENRSTGRRIAAILAVDLLGHPAHWDWLRDIARHYQLVLLADATESLGAMYRNKPVGSLADIACLSFNGNKIITTGGGGMVLTDNYEWAERVRYLSTQAKDDQGEYIHGEIGYNYRLTNLQAALGVAQMEQLSQFVAAKRAIASAYAQGLASVPGVTLPNEAPWASATYWLYTVRIDPRQFGLDSRGLGKEFAQAGIQTRPIWQPLPLSKPYREAPQCSWTVAETLYKEAISLPSSVNLDPTAQGTVISKIRELATHLGVASN